MKLTDFFHEYQMDAKDCVPDCLNIIAKHYCKYYSLIVVYKVSKSNVYVFDPAKGLISYIHEEYKDKWYKEDAT